MVWRKILNNSHLALDEQRHRMGEKTGRDLNDHHYAGYGYYTKSSST
jgi:hypothetical protein